ncbi:transposase [Streptomyces sp. JJ66]|nr:transposase [Streptomyces sp. JJ66]
MFASLNRSDQHRKAMYYLRGLLEVRGRKSIRAIAELFSDHVSEQNLHHFISSSTWDWSAMRQAFAEHVMDMMQPQAWVARLMIIPKSGQQSVGVERNFFPSVGRVLNAQRAIGIWATSQEMAVPLNWRLYLPHAWLRDRNRRSRVSIPDGVEPESLAECLMGVCSETFMEWELPVRPLIVDMCEAHTVTIFKELAASGVPLLVKVGRDLRLTVTDPMVPVNGSRELTAGQIMEIASSLRPPAVWTDSNPRLARLAATVRVALPSASTLPPVCDDLLLLGVRDSHGRGQKELWLTTMRTAQPASLMRLSRLTEKVEQDFTAISDRVGIRDYAGRSFDGWHRHVTLASAAHAIIALTGRPH